MNASIGVGAVAFGVKEFTNGDFPAGVLWIGLSVVAFESAAYKQRVLSRSTNDG